MAINSKDAIDAYEAKMTAPFSKMELDEINRREKDIDAAITEQFNGKQVNVILSLFRMASYDYSIPERRKNLIYEELCSRYKKAGWDLKVELDDCLDGPNMSGPDYMIISPKKTPNL